MSVSGWPIMVTRGQSGSLQRNWSSSGRFPFKCIGFSMSIWDVDSSSRQSFPWICGQELDHQPVHQDGVCRPLWEIDQFDEFHPRDNCLHPRCQWGLPLALATESCWTPRSVWSWLNYFGHHGSTMMYLVIVIDHDLCKIQNKSLIIR